MIDKKQQHLIRIKDKKLLYIGLTVFVSTMIIYAVIQQLSGLYPFGNKLNLLWDADIQYVDYFAFYRDVLLGKANLEYSFSKSLGGSLVALFGYYLGSPLNLFVVFFEIEQLPIFVFIITMVKMGLCSVSASVFMRKRFSDLEASAVAGLSMGYGLMQYMMLHNSNIMWLDGVFFLPLLLLAIYRFVREKRKVMLFVIVMLSIMINWYTGYMICLFAAFYFLYERILYMKNWTYGEWKGLFLDGVCCAFVMMLGLGGSAAVFYPVFKGLQKGKSVWDPTIFYPGFYDSFFDIFRGFAEGSIVGTVSLYCGMIFFLFFLYYFLCRQVELKEKILSGAAALFMFVSCWFVPLDCIWSGVRRVASYRFRYSFVVIFLVLYIAARGIEEYQKREERKRVVQLILGVLAVFLLSHVYRNYEIKTFVATLCTLIAYALIYMLTGNRRMRTKLIAALLIAELTANGVITFDFNYEANPEVSAYQEYAVQAKEQAELVKNYEEDVFWRMDTVTKRYDEESRCSAYLNDAMAYGYRGLAHYSSTYDTNISNMIYDIGYSSLHDFSIYTEPVLPTDALLGIKYVLSEHDITGLKKVEELGTVNGKQVYLNPYALSLGMGAADTVFRYAESENPFEFQNQLFSNILGERVELFHQVQAEFKITDGTLSFYFPEGISENLLYGCVNSTIPDLALYVDGAYRCNYATWLSYRIFDIGMMDKEHRIELTGYFGNEADMEGLFYYLDKEIFEQILKRLNGCAFEPERFEDGYVSGSYEAEGDGWLLLTVPYDDGWHAQVNGEEVLCQEGANALTVVPVYSGENKIVMQYQAPGKRTGMTITICSVILMGFWHVWEKKRKALRFRDDKKNGYKI